MTIYFVDTNHASALDTNAGTTEALPWKTIQKAATTMVSGDTVNIKQGTYTGAVNPVNSGTASARITYKAFPGHEHLAIMNGNGGFNIIAKSYITVSGLRVQNQTTSNTIYMEGPGSNITISGCRTFDTIGSGINAFGAPYNPSVWDTVSPGSLLTDILIENNIIELANNGGFGENITLVYGVDRFEVRGNELFSNASMNNSFGGEGIDAKQGVRNGKIHNNYIHELRRIGIYIDGSNWYATDIEVYNNHLRNTLVNQASGIIISKERPGGTVDGIKVYNNIIYGWGRDGIDVFRHPGDTDGLNMRNVTISNNTTYNNGAESGHGGGGVAITFPSANNIVCTNNIAFGNIDFQLIFTTTGTGNVNSNNLVTNPLWVNSAGGDFHLQSTSSAINTGTSVGAPATDFDGVARPQGPGFDIGAFEFTVATPTTYRLKRALTSGGPYTVITPTNFSSTSFIDTGVVNGTNYRYVVTANTQNGESVNSNEVSLTPASQAAPAVPTLSGTAGNGQVSLAWNASAGAVDYRVKRGTASGGPYSVVATVTTTSFNHTGLTNGQTGYYVVSARNGALESANSNQVQLTPAGSTAPSPFKMYIQLVGNAEIQNSPNFDALHAQLYRGNSNTTKGEVLDIVYVNGSCISMNTFGEAPNRDSFISCLRTRYGIGSTDSVALDIENLNPPSSQTHATHHANCINYAKEALPSAKIGSYPWPFWTPGYMTGSVAPVGSTTYNAWHAGNIAFQATTDAAQIFFPSLYVRTTDRNVWVNSARGSIDEMWNRMPGVQPKKIYPYLSLDYENGISPSSLLKDDLPGDYFRLLLDTLSTSYFSSRGVEGVVIWVGGKTWASARTRPWWTALWQFLGFSGPPPGA